MVVKIASEQRDVRRGWPGMPCPHCGEVDKLAIRVSDGLLECCECEEEFTSQELKNMGQRLLSLAAFLETVPLIEEDYGR